MCSYAPMTRYILWRRPLSSDYGHVKDRVCQLWLMFIFVLLVNYFPLIICKSLKKKFQYDGILWLAFMLRYRPLLQLKTSMFLMWEIDIRPDTTFFNSFLQSFETLDLRGDNMNIWCIRRLVIDWFFLPEFVWRWCRLVSSADNC